MSYGLLSGDHGKELCSKVRVKVQIRHFFVPAGDFQGIKKTTPGCGPAAKIARRLFPPYGFRGTEK